MSAEMIPLLTKALGETVYMVAVSMVISSALGIPLGVLLHVTARGEILDAPAVNRSVGAVVNAIRSIPFIILMVAIIPLTRLIVGSAIGTTAAMVPLVIASVPFIGRQVETSLREVPHGLIEAALSMGATPLQIVTRVSCRSPCPASSASSRRSSSHSSASPPWPVRSAAAVSAISRSATATSGSVPTSCSRPSSFSSFSSSSCSSWATPSLRG